MIRHLDQHRALVLLALGSLLLCVCGPTDRSAAPEAAEGPNETLASALESVHLDQLFRGDLDGMKERRIIRALVVYNQTNYFLDGGTQRGVTYEAMRAFEKWLNRDRGTGEEVHVIMLPVTRGELIPALREGRGDLAAASLTITPERLAQVDFSLPVLEGVKEIPVSGPAGPSLSSLDDLASQQVWVTPASSYYESLAALNETLTADGLEPMVIRSAHGPLETEDLLEMVNAGLIGITVADDYLAELWNHVYDDITLHPELAVRNGGEIGWMFRKQSPKLKAAVDAFVQTHKKGTLYGNILFKRYLKSLRWVRNPLEQADMARFEATSQIFKTYADRYNFDWLMMAAQGYQESRLDQGARSPAGAVGVMQLLPSTAAGKAVGIPNIHERESNIHAGIKYMRWITDTYFSDAGVDKLNKTLFAFASYNAGPSRIARLRKQAAQEGLDPNVWFRNVERVVARKVGRETIQYVSNIYKYWVAYRLVLEQKAKREAARGTI